MGTWDREHLLEPGESLGTLLTVGSFTTLGYSVPVIFGRWAGSHLLFLQMSLLAFHVITIGKIVDGGSYARST
jgi:hypothetical protein